FLTDDQREMVWQALKSTTDLLPTLAPLLPHGLVSERRIVSGPYLRTTPPPEPPRVERMIDAGMVPPRTPGIESPPAYDGTGFRSPQGEFVAAALALSPDDRRRLRRCGEGETITGCGQFYVEAGHLSRRSHCPLHWKGARLAADRARKKKAKRNQ